MYLSPTIPKHTESIAIEKIFLPRYNGTMDIRVWYLPYVCADMFLALDKDQNGTLGKQELKEYADGTLTEIFIERG